MAGFAESIRNIWSVQELRERILYTLGILLIYRLGTHVTLPGVDAAALAQVRAQEGGGGLFGFLDMFVGGAFKQAGIFALGIMPYITASIIIQLMGAVVPYFQKLQREGEEGRRRITQLTRYGTIGITALQSIGYSINLLAGATGRAVVINSTLFTITTVVVLTSGTAFVMWLGERISEDGIGNGISLIITIGIIAFLPQALYNEIGLIGDNFFILLVEIGVWVLVAGAVVLVSQGMRRIPVQYAKRVVGKKVQGGTTQYLPLRVNAAGVMPIIFAQSIMFIPSTIASFFPNNATMQRVGGWFSDISSMSYSAVFFVVVVFFTYFYTAITVNPQEMADTMKRQGGFIPGIRPGKQTSEFIDTVLTRITLPGSIFLGLVAIFPAFAMQAGVSQGFAMFYGGTSLLILVQVTLDTLQQIESHLLMRHYDGFMKSGKMRSPRQGGGL
ncbi:preprotein translocase subunit SecY [Salinibacter ruber]|jgi:preprotein translocase subunit SecY|uniref:Protein translocase subunit SecY n=3 Tax=Salinibacter ruber TaxID=146919 RepID=Q2S3P5_SALRD|nr:MULTISPECIES: preprotein translocase subunit SecY [Salinibacter]ABC44290.1 preprotein translocase, SecY subunit [Salinibacter ruber DSM 13855]MBB4060858.1 preprotein translocase subunit SecY [Salinibacter ruber]MBB4070489.1 preprotein translocase subunit SecY [Salinibacter ruber]MBB4091251.1 preprotein translocase subunit SecY [Salinibacter ruber]MCS3612235.1 preprotein translocase subunit SecY [Salinibacter ruber]